MKKILTIILLILLCTTTSVCNAQKLPKIAILATGGTIAGSTDAGGTSTTGYTAGVLTIDTLIKAVPEIAQIAEISGEQICNIDSSNMTDEIWLKLAKRINTLLESVDGIVITHGTDTMEETAYFLNLVVKSDKPVVLVGAMRPATAISADGPKNLYNAVALAGSKSAKGKGVMVAMDDTILGARDVVKTHTLQTSTFKALNSGPLGIIIDGKPFFYSSVSRPHTINSEFNVSNLNTLPKVDILYTYSNDGSKVAAEAFLKAGAKGLVVAGSGAWSIHENQKNYLLDAAKNKQVVVVRSSRVGSGYVPDAKDGILNADNLNPQKARVLLMLALTKTSDPKQIQDIFNKY